MTTEKLIDDAVTAFTDREITPPSRDDLRTALNAYEASLTRCGCHDCTTARRERIALSDHDRKSLARVLHQIVYSPGANYDRAVPGVQEHMLACAEKVAAALPWIAPHTPTDDERELRRLRDIEKDYDTNFPCDGGCNTNEGPEETCSRHGRSPRDLWNLLDAERRPEPQGEPSDAQVVAALNAFWPDSAAPSIHSWTKDGFADDMRAALRAAGGVR